MSEGYVVEIEDETIGIVVRQEGERCFRFHASAREFHALDGSVHASPLAAQRAAMSLVAERRRGKRQHDAAVQQTTPIAPASGALANEPAMIPMAGQVFSGRRDGVTIQRQGTAFRRERHARTWRWQA